jgi:signal peptidase I|tara:strand:+ start:3743 stop:4354 length:612 start_codon:yes stop_codon:yes gene_type:complete
MNSKKKLKNLWDQFWFLLWKDDSLKGWVFSIIIIFVFIKFIFFPGLSLVTGTSLPLAIVESCSMYHNGNLLSNYNEWLQDHEEKYSEFEIENFKDFKFKKGFNKGDILLVTGANPEKLKVGDVVIFDGGANHPIIHRIIEINGNTFSTIGDNNNGQLSFEKNISTEKIIGKAKFKIAPYVGWLKLIFFENKKPSSEKGLCKER